MDAASQPAPPRRRTPRRTYTATRVSHPNYSRFTCPAAGLPSPLTHLWRPPAIAGAGGHAQVDSGTPYRGRGQARGAAGLAPSSPDRAGRAPGLPTPPQLRWRCPRSWWGRSAPRPPVTVARVCWPPSGRPGHSPPAVTRASPTVVGRRLVVTFPVSRGGTHRSPPAVGRSSRHVPSRWPRRSSQLLRRHDERRRAGRDSEGLDDHHRQAGRGACPHKPRGHRRTAPASTPTGGTSCPSQSQHP